MPELEWTRFFPEAVADAIQKRAERLTEVRLRAGWETQLKTPEDETWVPPVLAPEEIRRIAIDMMENSYYACENQLANGYFTMRCGCRVGVAGAFSENGGQYALNAIGSMCIRIARERKGCAQELFEHVERENGISNALIISPPGLGKTTLLRDLARLISESGRIVGIADERGEIAAARVGVPKMDVGARTDVIDGCRKHIAMRNLIRSMAPEVILTDEIGDARDRIAVREAARRGVNVIATAHARDMDDLSRGSLRELLQDGLFEYVFVLSERPGNIGAIWKRNTQEGYRQI